MDKPRTLIGGTGVPPVPGGGTGVPPVVTERITHRNLPHWQVPYAVHFLTWRCRPGIRLTDADRNHALATILFWHGKRWDVLATVVMPDHVHVLTTPLRKGDGFWDLSELVHSVKSYSAHRINRHRAACGSVWLDERYDRWMRDDDEVAEKHGYILSNPVKAGLCASPHVYPWLFDATHRRDAGATGSGPEGGGTGVPPVGRG